MKMCVFSRVKQSRMMLLLTEENCKYLYYISYTVIFVATIMFSIKRKVNEICNNSIFELMSSSFNKSTIINFRTLLKA